MIRMCDYRTEEGREEDRILAEQEAAERKKILAERHWQVALAEKAGKEKLAKMEKQYHDEGVAAGKI